MSEQYIAEKNNKLLQSMEEGGLQNALGQVRMKDFKAAVPFFFEPLGGSIVYCGGTGLHFQEIAKIYPRGQFKVEGLDKKPQITVFAVEKDAFSPIVMRVIELTTELYNTRT